MEQPMTLKNRVILALADFHQEPNGKHNRPPAGLGVPPSRL
jgi:hypothetical protein